MDGDISLRFGSKSPQTLVYLIIAVAIYCGTIKGCQEYDGTQYSECASGFPLPFDIDQTQGKTSITTKSGRQTLIPDINFSCNGTITKLLIGAKWQGSTPGFTQFQVWRKSSTNGSTYQKVGEVTIRVGNENSSELYEYKLETPLPFREGDIFGYFQPNFTHSELNLYLEDSSRITTYYSTVCNQCVYPPPIGNTFSLESSSTDSKYPLVTVSTDPPNCGCGFMSANRMMSLMNSSQSTSTTHSPTQAFVLAPNLKFKCTGTIIKWTVRGRPNIRSSESVIQIWRQLDRTTSVYERVDGTDTVLSRSSLVGSGIYELKPVNPIPVEPGDVIGIVVPENVLFLPEMESITEYYYASFEENSTTIDIHTINMTYGQPLIVAEISMAMVTPTVKSPSYPQITMETTPSNTNHSLRLLLTIGIGLLSLIITGVTIISLSLCITVRHRRQQNKKGAHLRSLKLSKASTLGEDKEDTDFIRDSTLYAYATEPTILTAAQQNEAYNIIESFHHGSEELSSSNIMRHEISPKNKSLTESLDVSTHLNAAYVTHIGRFVKALSH